MDGETVITANHEEIKNWILDHGGRPAIVGDKEKPENEVGLRVDFPGHNDEALLRQDEPNPDVSWEDFFKIFEDKDLTFMYYTSTKEIDDLTLAYRFVPREVREDPGDIDQTSLMSY